MSLLVWLPMTKDLSDQGLGGCTITNNGATLDNNGKLGKCYNFDGTNISFNRPLPNPCSAFTVCGWVKLSTGYNANYGLHILSFEMVYGRICISKDGLAVRVLLNYNGTNSATGSTATASSISANVWNHYAVTFDSGKINIYINGQLDNSYTIGISQVAITSSILKVGTYLAEPSKGCVNDFRLYDHALSPKEIEILSRGLVCHYPLEGVNNTLLPFGYQQLDYIEGAGAAAFDTTYKFNPETDSVKITFKGNNTSNTGMLFGQSAAKYFWLYYYGSCGIRVYADNGSGQQSIAGISSDLNKHTAEYTNKHYYIDGTDKGSLSNTYAEQTNTSWICSYGNTSYGFKGRIYFAQICKSGVPQRTFIPAKRLSDSKIGMYDVSNNVFYPSNTSTAFTAGNVVGTPTTIHDCSGYQYNGTINGSLTVSSDTARYSTSTEFSKTGYITNSSFRLTTNAFTVNFWVKLKTASSQHFVLGTFDNWTSNGFGLYRETNGAHYQSLIRSTAESTYKQHIIYLTSGAWQMLTYVYTGTHYKGYLNGVLSFDDTYGSNGNVSHPVLYLANSKYSSTPASENEEAFLSDFRFYATALSDSQVAELYNTAVSVANNGALMGYELVEV